MTAGLQPSQCPFCGYDRAGLAETVACPECGRASTAADRKRLRRGVVHWRVVVTSLWPWAIWGVVASILPDADGWLPETAATPVFLVGLAAAAASLLTAAVQCLLLLPAHHGWGRLFQDTWMVGCLSLLGVGVAYCWASLLGAAGC